MTARTLAWTSFILVFAFTLMAASRFAVLDPVENATLDVTSPVQATLRSVTRPTADWVNNLTDAGRLSSENQRLRTENERLTNELARAREEAAAQQQAQEVAEVRAAFPEQQFVVGTVSKTFDDYAWVTLITDPKSAVSARVQESRAEGVVSGNYGGELEMEFVGQGALVKEGDFVITSGVGGTYPPGFTIGRVGTVETREQELFQRVTVAPLAALSDLETVMVLTTFEPQDLQRP
jgi:cell shape-determining protein MreC